MKPLTPAQEAIKEAVITSLLDQSTLVPLLLRSQAIIRIFRVSPQELCMMRKEGILPATRIKRSFYYNPIDLFELLTQEQLLN